MADVPNSGPAAPPPPVWDAQPSGTGVQRYAGFWMRVLAAVIDAIALAILSKLIGFFLPAPQEPPDTTDLGALMTYASAMLPPSTLIANALLVWAYFAFQESSSAQASLGKRLLGLRVSTEDGGKLTLAAASLRAWPMYLGNVGWLVVPALGWLITLAALIACISVAFSDRKQGLHDRMAKALLTKTR